MKQANTDIGFIKAGLMVFYKGAISYDKMESMPFDEIFQLNDYASRLEKRGKNDK